MTFGRRCLLPMIGSLVALSFFLLTGPCSPRLPRPLLRQSLYFVHLGDIWRYDAGLGTVDVAETGGRPVRR